MAFVDHLSDCEMQAPATTLQHGAKISLHSMVILIEAFVYVAPINKAAIRADVHRDTARDTYAALRDRLASPRFEKWVQSTNRNTALKDEDDQAQMTQANDALFLCHENTNCKKRYRAGRRKNIVCRSCPLFRYVSDHVPEPTLRYAGAENLVHLVYDILDFYAQLGWNESVNSGDTEREVFDKRFRHFEIYNNADAHSPVNEKGWMTADEDDFLSMRHLRKEILEELKDRPLKS